MPDVLDLYPWVGEAFEDVRPTDGGRKLSARCPVGKHETARVNLWLGHDGNLMFGCWSGACNKRDILAAVGRKMRDCFPSGTVPDTAARQITATYPYRDEKGEILYEIVRFEPGFHGREKDLRPRRWVGGKWVYGLPREVRRVLYRLPELIAAPPTVPVWVAGGEKDCDYLAKYAGILATTSTFGESSPWLAEYSAVLAGRPVIVVPDRDAAGARHCDEVVGSLVRHGAACLTVADRLPGKDAAAAVLSLRSAGVTTPTATAQHLYASAELSPTWAPREVEQ